MDYQKTIPDSSQPEIDFERHEFFLKDGKYFTYDLNRKNKVKVELSNFVGESLFHLINGTNNTKRIIKIQRNTGQISIIEVLSSELKLDSFETILKSKQCTFYGNTQNLKKIFAQWMDNEIQANVIETMGWNPEYKVYAFSNAVFTDKNVLLHSNDVGIIDNPDDEKKKYYLPAFGLAQINNQNYEGERKFIYIEGEKGFEEYAKLYFTAFETNGGIAILFLILSVFWDIVFEQIGFFPFLFLFGSYGTGKTSLVEFLLRVFGKDFKGIPLNNATQVALSRTIASRNNSIFYLKEYTKDTDEFNNDLFLTAYDGTGRATGIKSNDNQTRVAMVKSAIILDGNELPTQKTAVLSRMILLNFEKNKFTTDQHFAFNELEKIKDSGFGKVLTDILKHREYFQKNFKKIFDENIKELRESIPGDYAERTRKHIALLLVPAKLLIEKLQFPFSFNEITNAVVDNAIEQNRLLKQTDEITIFWNAFAYGIRNNNLVRYNKEGETTKKQSHYHLKINQSCEAILQIKFQSIIPEYVKYCKNIGQRFLDSNSMQKLLTSESYKPFIRNSQKGRVDAYTDAYFGSCYQFVLNTENGYSINGVELNM